MITEWHADGFVYFIGSDQCELVKIGYSVAPELRLKACQAGCPVPLRILAMFRAPLSVESRLHRRFRDRRSHGEWFRPAAELLEIIATAARGETPNTEFVEAA